MTDVFTSNDVVPLCAQREHIRKPRILILTMDKQKKTCGLLNKFFWPIWTQMHILHFKHLPSLTQNKSCALPGIQAEFCLLSWIGFRFLRNNILCSSTGCELNYSFFKKIEKTGKLSLWHTWVCCSERNAIRSVKCWFILKIKTSRKLYVFRACSFK